MVTSPLVVSVISLFIGYVLTHYSNSDASIMVSGDNLSLAMPRQPSGVQFPYFFFFTGVFYGFVAGIVFTSYLTWKFILKPKGSRNRSRNSSTSPTRPDRSFADAVVQGPATYHPQKGKRKKYDDLPEQFWGAWWY